MSANNNFVEKIPVEYTHIYFCVRDYSKSEHSFKVSIDQIEDIIKEIETKRGTKIYPEFIDMNYTSYCGVCALNRKPYVKIWLQYYFYKGNEKVYDIEYLPDKYFDKLYKIWWNDP